MKKITLLAILLIASLSTFAQEEKKEEKEIVKKNEVTLNAFNLIIFKSIDFSYEYLLNSEASVGISILINLQDNEFDFYENGPYYNESFAITPYYRHFFSRKYAQGFFIEAFGMYNKQKLYDGYYDYNSGSFVSGPGTTSNNFAIGMSIGGKFVSRKGFIYEFYGGVGRNLVSSNSEFSTELVPRLAVSIGYRF